MKLCVVVLHLLLLNQIAQSFVLLTANIEDIKKLAKKFVSESLAEKIADFIARATERMITNVSEENVRNEVGFQDVSKENNKLYNIGRQRTQKEYQKPTQKYHQVQNTPRKPIKKMVRTTKNVERVKRTGRVNLKSAGIEIQNTSVNKEPEKTFEKYNPVKQYSYTIKEKEKQKQARITVAPMLDSTIGFAEKMHSEDSKPKVEPEDSSSKFLNPKRFRLTANSKEKESIKPNDFDKMQNDLTTRKERNEFDQYDNPKYTKEEYVATSGPVSLPKIPSDDWWNEDKKFKKNKPWD